MKKNILFSIICLVFIFTFIFLFSNNKIEGLYNCAWVRVQLKGHQGFLAFKNNCIYSVKLAPKTNDKAPIKIELIGTYKNIEDTYDIAKLLKKIKSLF